MRLCNHRELQKTDGPTTFCFKNLVIPLTFYTFAAINHMTQYSKLYTIISKLK